MGSAAHRQAAIALSLLLVILAALPLGPGTGPVAAASGDKRPNLQMLSLRDWRIETINGRRLLRFTTIFANAGPGHFELRGARSSTSDPTMDMDQLMYRWDGTSRRIDTSAIGRYSGDGHDQWHVQDVVILEAWKENDQLITRRGAKTGFCFFDTTAWDFSLRGARQSPYYQEAWCGTRSSLTNRVGVSVGWGDRYPWNFVYQWIDITDVPGGIWRVRATVDLHDRYDETVETDNCVWTKIRIPANGQPTIYENGADCGVEAMTPVSSYTTGVTWDPPEAVLVEAGRRVGHKFNSQGTILATKRWTPRADRVVSASARALVPGQSGRWLYMASGPLAGYWVRQSDEVKLAP